MPKIIEDATQELNDALTQGGYQAPNYPPPTRSGFRPSGKAPRMTEDQIPDYVVQNPNSPQSQLWRTTRSEGYVEPGGRRDYGPSLNGAQRQSIPFDPGALQKVIGQNKYAKVTDTQRQGARDRAAARNIANRERSDERLRGRLAGMDPARRQKRITTINANRARQDEKNRARGLPERGPIDGAQMKREVPSYKSLGDVSEKTNAPGQRFTIEDGEGQQDTYIANWDEFGQPSHILQHQDETGQWRGPLTYEETQQRIEDNLNNLNKQSLIDSRSTTTGLSTAEKIQNYDWEAEWDDLGSKIAGLQETRDTLKSEIQSNRDTLKSKIESGEALPEQQDELIKILKEIEAHRERHRAIIAERDMATAKSKEDARKLQGINDTEAEIEAARTGKPKETSVIDRYMPTISEQADFDALPSGTHYIDAGDGKVHVKP